MKIMHSTYAPMVWLVGLMSCNEVENCRVVRDARIPVVVIVLACLIEKFLR
jgi:hypothetical protein